jgi:ADP-ribose pyrophosphatase YjhB (NUDIX family)
MWINSIEKRETSKGVILVNDPNYGKCILLHKEQKGKYSLPGWWIEKWESESQALQRKLTEELFQNLWAWYENQAIILKQKHIENFETKSQLVHLYAVCLENKYMKLSGEWKWIWLYPLEDKYGQERILIEGLMEYNAKKAVRDFRWKHDWKSYDLSCLRHREDDGLIENFYDELDALKKQVLKK